MDGEQTRGVSVYGEGLVEAEPDVAYVALGIATRNASLPDAQRETARAMTAVIERLRSLGLEAADIQTSGLAIWREERVEGERSRPGPFVVSNELRLRVRDVAAVGTVIDAAVAAGANTLQGVSFAVEDRAALESRAREEAVRDAAAKAAELARLAGVRLRAPVSVAESESGGSYDERGFAMKGRREMPFSSMESYDTPVEGGRTRVRVGVRVIYALE